MSSRQEHPQTTLHDARLYVPIPENWEVHLKQGWEKEYCYMQNPGEDYFHLLIAGELYLKRGSEKYCLNCAVRMGVLTTERHHWQKSDK